MSPSKVGNFRIGRVLLGLLLLWLVAGGWAVSLDDDVSTAASRSWAWRCMVLSLSISSSNSIIAASLSSSGMLSSYLADGFYVSWSSAKPFQLIHPIFQCRSFGVVCSGSAPLTGHGSGRVVCGGRLIAGCTAGCIHRSLVRIRLGGPENVRDFSVSNLKILFVVDCIG
ncbi:hypothetical protein T07_13990 [Trichinella nelsoni]|uniref:Secreted protein n=1 Tax=Trichinella nelsoni TaxID=6336 RepID=A0A0V0S406_9BILA|nr:hypothetical protein T07_13990 [Trichinella nelsoni]